MSDTARVAPSRSTLAVLCLAVYSACGDGAPVKSEPTADAQVTPSDGGMDAATGADDASPAPGDAGGPASDAAPDDPDAWRPGLGTFVCGVVTNKVDVLFVLDNSGSMADEQALLARELPHMLRALGSGDIDGDGAPEYRPASLHIGVVTTDMGADLGPTWGGSGCSLFGDDAILGSSCSAGQRVIAYPKDGSDPTRLNDVDPALISALECLPQVGIKGCGYEQQLEAALKAVTPTSSDLRFQRGTTGHADGENVGFLRYDSVLAIVLVTDEEDCSHSDEYAALTWQRDDGGFTYGNNNTRCERNPQALFPVGRYIEGLAAARANPNAFVFSLIAGVPQDLVDAGVPIGKMLEDSRMQYQPGGPEGELLPACTRTSVNDAGVAEVQSALPARRMLEVAAGFGERAVVSSICDDSFARSIEKIFQRISGVLECPNQPVL